MNVNKLKDSTDYACDVCERSEDLREVVINGVIVFHICQQDARELARRLVNAFSLQTLAGALHHQGSEIVSKPLSEDDIAARTKEHRSLRPEERRDGYDG